MTKIKVGQIGVGNFGAYRRGRMRETGLFDLVAAFDLNRQALVAAHEEDGAAICSSYEELLETPGLEGVVIATGAKYHAAQMLQAMDQGLPVFVEKPLCSTPEDMRILLSARRRSRVPVAVGHTDHANESYSRHVRALIEGGEVGDLVSIEATTCHSGGMVIKEGDWRGDPEKNPGGMLFQCGVHKLHEMMFYCGPVARVSAMMRYDANPRTKTADVAVCNLQFESGVLGSLNAYHITPYRHYTNIYGTKANLYLETHHQAGPQLLMQQVAPGWNGAMEPVIPVEVAGGGDSCGNLRSWYEAIRSMGTPQATEPTPSLLDGARAVAVVFAAEEAAKSGCTIDCRPYLQSSAAEPLARQKPRDAGRDKTVIQAVG